MLTSKIHQFSASFVLDEGNPRIIFSRPKEFPRDNDAKWYHQHMSPRQNGQHFPHDIFKCIFVNENAKISIKISLKFIPKCPINYIPALVKIMAWCQPGDKPLSEPTMTHICVTRRQWVNTVWNRLDRNIDIFIPYLFTYQNAYLHPKIHIHVSTNNCRQPNVLIVL